MCAMASMPPMRGMRKSMSTTSGLSQAASATASSPLEASPITSKSGWLASVTDRGRWIVNSVGRIIEPGHDWLVAVLSDHNPTEGGGIGTVEHLATTAVAGLRATPNPVS